mmetsp:Transcript_40376/g.133650  ORF Transcript_40376/g.133650 Transcript_40376/m.133650 type:complete len:227 (+) Transcript_40376:1933-2613(+)
MIRIARRALRATGAGLSSSLLGGPRAHAIFTCKHTDRVDIVRLWLPRGLVPPAHNSGLARPGRRVGVDSDRPRDWYIVRRHRPLDVVLIRAVLDRDRRAVSTCPSWEVHHSLIAAGLKGKRLGGRRNGARLVPPRIVGGVGAAHCDRRGRCKVEVDGRRRVRSTNAQKLLDALVDARAEASGRLLSIPRPRASRGRPSEQCRALVRRVACCHGDQGISKGVDVLGP